MQSFEVFDPNTAKSVTAQESIDFGEFQQSSNAWVAQGQLEEVWDTLGKLGSILQNIHSNDPGKHNYSEKKATVSVQAIILGWIDIWVAKDQHLHLQKLHEKTTQYPALHECVWSPKSSHFHPVNLVCAHKARLCLNWMLPSLVLGRYQAEGLKSSIQAKFPYGVSHLSRRFDPNFSYIFHTLGMNIGHEIDGDMVDIFSQNCPQFDTKFHQIFAKVTQDRYIDQGHVLILDKMYHALGKSDPEINVWFNKMQDKFSKQMPHFEAAKLKSKIQDATGAQKNMAQAKPKIL